jgi:hypothetical protein
MARYRKISVCIWNDEKFNALSDDGQLIFLFILTHPNMTSIGAMRTTIEGLAAEKGWTVERLSKAFLEASSKGMLEYDKTAKCLILPNFIKHNRPESPNVITGWIKVIDLVPECYLKYKQLDNISSTISLMGEAFRKAFQSLREAYPKAFRKSMPNQEQEQDIREPSQGRGFKGTPHTILHPLGGAAA